MLDLNNWELVGLAVDVFVVWLINRSYKNQVKDASFVSNAKTYEVGEELKTVLDTAVDKCLPYACVVGLTKPIGSPLKSHHTDAVGVIQHRLYVEHKSKRTQGFWADMKNVITDQFNIRPFVLVSSDSAAAGSSQQWAVEVTDALSADYLRDSLTVIHDRYKPSSGNLLSRSLDRLFGEVTKGYQETERMLGVGVPLLGIGKLVLIGGKHVVLSPPDDGCHYILTTCSKQELVASLKSVARTLNIARWLFGLAGLSYLAYLIYRTVLKYKSERESRQWLAALQARRQAAARAASDTENITPANEDAAALCAVCMSLPREVVLLNCGHMCVCGECAVALPEPKLCPICRQPIVRIVPTYIS